MSLATRGNTMENNINRRYNLRSLPGGRRASAKTNVLASTTSSSSQSTSSSSLFSSPYSSPKSFERLDGLSRLPSPISSTRSLSSPTSMTVDVVQQANADIVGPTTAKSRARRKWTIDMNMFIWRTYLITSRLETQTRGYLDSLYNAFTTKYPEMNASKQNVGDQRRAIINNKLLSSNILDDIRNEVTDYLKQSEQPFPTITQTSHRMSWSNQINETILRIYFEVTELETDITAHRKKLHEKFIEHYPHLSHLSEQRISDQRRAIVNNKMIPETRIIQIRNEVETYLRISERTRDTTTDYSHIQLNETITDQIADEELLLTTPLANTNIDYNQYTEHTNTTHDIDHHNIHQQFNSALEMFTNTDPTSRPYLPRQKPSKRLAMIVQYIDKSILPKLLTTDQDFTNFQTTLYSAAYTAVVCNGTKINPTQTVITHRTPPWQRRLENKIEKFRSEIARLTQYINGNRSNRIITAVEAIKIKYKVHAQHENDNSQIEHF